MIALTTQEGFYQAIRQAPDDTDLIHAYAGWMADRDPVAAEHIWVQLALERYPLADSHYDPLYCALVEGEDSLRRRRWWRGTLEPMAEDLIFRPLFRRGLVQTAGVTAHPSLKVRDAFRRQCPFLRRLEINQARGWGASLAKLAALKGIAELCFVGWLDEADARGLAAAPYLEDLETLEFWVGGRDDQQVVNILAELPGLKRLVLHQVYGGIQAGNQARALAERADALAADANQRRGAVLAVVNRPWEATFALAACVGHELFAGRLPSGQNALCGFREDRAAIVLHRFGADGHFQGCDELIPPRTTLVRRGLFPGNKFLLYMRRRFGFQLGPARIKEFRAASGLSVSLYSLRDYPWLTTPEDVPPYSGAPGMDRCASLHAAIHRGWFKIDIGHNDFLVDRPGKIISWRTASTPARLRGILASAPEKRATGPPPQDVVQTCPLPRGGGAW